MGFTRNDLKTNTGTGTTVATASTASASTGELCIVAGWLWDNGATATVPSTFSDGTDTYTLFPNSHQVGATNFHTFVYYATLSRNVTTYAPSFAITNPGSSREWRVALMHYTPDSTPSTDQCVGQVSTTGGSSDTTATATTDALAELAISPMTTDLAGASLSISDPTASSNPTSGWLAGGLYRIQNNSASQAGSVDEYNGTGLHSIAAKCVRTFLTGANHTPSSIATFKTAGGAAFDPAAVPWPGQLPDPVQVQLVEF